MLLERVAFVGGVLNLLAFEVDVVDFAYLEIAAGELPLQLGGGGAGVLLVEGVEVEMIVAVGPVTEDDAAVSRLDVVIVVDEFVVARS